MKLKNIIWKTVIACIALPCCIACSDDDEESTLYGPKIYLSNGVIPMTEIQWNVLQTPVGVKSDYTEVKFPVKVTQPLTSDVVVSVEIDPSAVDTYNAAHKTSYQGPTDDSYNFTKNSVTIKAGETESSDSISCTITDFKKLNAQGGHLIPFKLSESSSGATLSSNMNMMYLKINNSFSNIDQDAKTVEGVTCDRTNWTYTSSVSGYLSDAFDGDLTTYWEAYTWWEDKVTLDIDFGSKVAMKGITLSPCYYEDRWASEKYPYNLKTVEVLISENNNSWISQGKIVFDPIDENASEENPALNVIKFYGPITTQYVRLSITDSWCGDYIDAYVGEINVIK